MTVETKVVPTQKASVRRRLAGLGVAVVILALVSIPVATYTFSAGIFFVGWDADPDPVRGVYCVGIVLFLLALPPVSGLVIARVLTARGWRIALAAAALILSLWSINSGGYF